MGAQTHKEGSYSRYVFDGGAIWSDFIFKRHLDHVESGRNEKHNEDETGGDAGGALGHTRPFFKSVGDAESSQGYNIRVDD